jgi:hypothetical protein
MDAALIVERHRAGTWATAGEYVTKFGKPHLGTVLRDQPHDTQPAAALARDFQHRDLAGNIAKRGGAVAGHCHGYAGRSSLRGTRYVCVPISTSARPSMVSRRKVPV